MTLLFAYLVPRIALILVCAWGIAIGFKNWQVNRAAAKLVMIASIIRLSLMVWSLPLLIILGGDSLSATAMLGRLIDPLLSSLLEATVIALLIYAVFRGRPGANLWPFRSR
jgi:hypothetical protein